MVPRKGKIGLGERIIFFFRTCLKTTHFEIAFRIFLAL